MSLLHFPLAMRSSLSAMRRWCFPSIKSGHIVFTKVKNLLLEFSIRSSCARRNRKRNSWVSKSDGSRLIGDPKIKITWDSMTVITRDGFLWNCLRGTGPCTPPPSPGASAQEPRPPPAAQGSGEKEGSKGDPKSLGLTQGTVGPNMSLLFRAIMPAAYHGEHKMTSIENISAAFDTMVPGLAADFEDSVRKHYKRLSEKYTPREFRRLGNDEGGWFDSGIYRNLVGPFVGTIGNKVSGEAYLDEDRLARSAVEYAENQVASFVNKIKVKLVDLTSVEIPRINGATFIIRGKLNGQTVRVNQNQTFNISNKGTPYHQWPARIYVDNKFTPAAAFKKLAKET